MYTLKTNASFDSAHFLAGYEGKCSNIHGHHWTVEIEVGSNSLEMGGNNRGMIVDFSKLKTDLKNIADALDHCLIVEIGSLKRRTLDVLEEEHFKVVEVMFRPTAENFAKFSAVGRNITSTTLKCSSSSTSSVLRFRLPISTIRQWSSASAMFFRSVFNLEKSTIIPRLFPPISKLLLPTSISTVQ